MDISIDRNTDTEIIFSILDEGGEQIDLSGLSLRMQVRQKPQSLRAYDELSTENGRLVVLDDGTLLAKIGHENSMKYASDTCYFDILSTDSDGMQERLCAGRILVSKEVTR